MKTLKTMLIAIILLVILVAPVFGEELKLEPLSVEFKYDSKLKFEPINNKKWTNYDTALLILKIIDWGQTNNFTPNYGGNYSKGNPYSIENSKPQIFHEINPILGPTPSRDKIDIYFISSIALDFLVVKYASPKIHKYWTAIQLIIETYCVTGNFSLGVNVKF